MKQSTSRLAVLVFLAFGSACGLRTPVGSDAASATAPRSVPDGGAAVSPDTVGTAALDGADPGGPIPDGAAPIKDGAAIPDVAVPAPDASPLPDLAPAADTRPPDVVPPAPDGRPPFTDGGAPPPDGPIFFDDAGQITVVSVAIAPAMVSVRVGRPVIVRAIATLSDGGQRDVSGTCAWSIADPGIATVTSGGSFGATIEGQRGGTTFVTADLAGIIGRASVIVAERGIETLRISPDRPVVNIGMQLQMSALASANGAERDVTGMAQWSSSSPDTAAIGSGGLASCKTLGVATISAAFMGKTATTTITCVVSRQFSSLTLTPSALTLTVSGDASFKALALYSDGTAEDVTASASLTASDPMVVSFVGSAEIEGSAPGSATITATYMGRTATAKVVVVANMPTAIQLLPPTATVRVGGGVALAVIALFKDGHAENLDAVDSWTSSNPMIASVDSQGSVTGQAVGQATVTASFLGLTASASITVSVPVLKAVRISPNNPELRVGEQLPVTAWAVYSDGTSSPVTDQVLWASSDSKVAVVERDTGLLVALAVGTATIQATYQGLVGATTVAVTPAKPTALYVSPASLVLWPGEVKALQAVLAFDDGSSQDVTAEAGWRSSDTGIADVDSTGMVSALGVGQAVLTANFAGLTATVLVKVSGAALVSLAVTPGMLSLGAGESNHLALVGKLDDGTSVDLTAAATWVSSRPAVALVSSGAADPGRVTAVAAGTASITATYMTQHASAAVTVP